MNGVSDGLSQLNGAEQLSFETTVELDALKHNSGWPIRVLRRECARQV